ncbi:MAG: HORMA domain containing protein [Minwuiales bacterium]|nr:HORMA domain containing protein [Minwuiales bacterium]
MSTYAFSYNRAQTSIFASDAMRNVLRDIIKWSGLDQTRLVDDWSVLGNAVRTWLGTGDLTEITIEFYHPSNGTLISRWDFPISYDGSGIDDDMWVAKEHIRRTIEKAPSVPSYALYRVLLSSRPGRPDVDGMSPATYKSTNGMVGRSSGTAVATPDIMASIRYWRAA